MFGAEFHGSWEIATTVSKRKRKQESWKADSRGMSICGLDPNSFAVVFSSGTCRIFEIAKNDIIVKNEFQISENCPLKIKFHQNMLYCVDSGGNVKIFTYESLMKEGPVNPKNFLKIQDGGLCAIAFGKDEFFVAGDGGSIHRVAQTEEGLVLKVNYPKIILY